MELEQLYDNIPMPPDTVLIIDDDEINRAILDNLFSESYVILEAENGRDGLEKILSQHGILPPMPEEPEDPEASNLPPDAPAIFPARTEEVIACPRCGRRQKGNRNACYACGLPFQYEAE